MVANVEHSHLTISATMFTAAAMPMPLSSLEHYPYAYVRGPLLQSGIQSDCDTNPRRVDSLTDSDILSRTLNTQQNSMFHLRLVNDSHHVCFHTTRPFLRVKLNDAFLRLMQNSHQATAELQVFHPRHGWNRVCADHVYIIVKNPLVLDYQFVHAGIVSTLDECDQWPTEAEQAARRAKSRACEREQDAEIRRRRFYVVPRPERR